MLGTPITIITDVHDLRESDSLLSAGSLQLSQA